MGSPLAAPRGVSLGLGVTVACWLAYAPPASAQAEAGPPPSGNDQAGRAPAAEADAAGAAAEPSPGEPPAEAPDTSQAAEDQAGMEASPPPAVTEAAEPTGEAEAPAEATEGGEIVESGAGLFEASQAEAEAGDEQAAGSAASRTVDYTGYVRADTFVGKVPGFSQGVIQSAYGELALKLTVKPEKFGDAFAEARLRYGYQGEQSELIVDLREAYVNAYLGPLDLRLGHQIIVWGRADGFNPTNNITPIDLRVRSPNEDDRRMGNVGARAFLNLEPIRIEAVWMPLYRANELPVVKLPQYVFLTDPDYPVPELFNSLGAGRIHLLLPSFETSVSYLFGYAPMPGLVLHDFTMGIDPPEVRLSRTAYQHHVVGFDFATTFGELLALRGEAAYRHPLEEEAVHTPQRDLQYVLGADREFGPVMVIVQYLGRYVFDWQKERGPSTPVSPAELAAYDPTNVPGNTIEAVTGAINSTAAVFNQALFQQTEEVQHLASVRLEWKTLHDNLSLSALGMVNFSTEEWLLYPKLAYQLTDRMSAALGGEVYYGPEGTMLSLVDQSLTAAYLELKMSF